MDRSCLTSEGAAAVAATGVFAPLGSGDSRLETTRYHGLFKTTGSRAVVVDILSSGIQIHHSGILTCKNGEIQTHFLLLSPEVGKQVVCGCSL